MTRSLKVVHETPPDLSPIWKLQMAELEGGIVEHYPSQQELAQRFTDPHPSQICGMTEGFLIDIWRKYISLGGSKDMFHLLWCMVYEHGYTAEPLEGGIFLEWDLTNVRFPYEDAA